jgi:oxygen-independent coproporphyrinogen-3 oxidase
MVGLGAGARAYTQRLHYSTDYAVARTGTIDIINDYLALDETRFAQAEHGIVLDPQEQRRRFVIQSLLTDPGLDLAAYGARFGSDCMQDLPQLLELGRLDLLDLFQEHAGVLRLNDRGYAYADTIGPWLASDQVRMLMAEGGPAC